MGNSGLADVRRDLLRLGADVTAAIPSCTAALLTGNGAAAQLVIDGDDRLDELASDIEDRCYEALADHPDAAELRALVGATRLASELERSGDLVVNIAKAACRMGAAPPDLRLHGLLDRMSSEAHELLLAAVVAFERDDDGLATTLDRRDDGLDALHRHFIARVLDSCRAGAIDIQVAVQLAVVGRFYERLGDHAVNIGQRVVFMVTGSRASSEERVALR